MSVCVLWWWWLVSSTSTTTRISERIGWLGWEFIDYKTTTTRLECELSTITCETLMMLFAQNFSPLSVCLLCQHTFTAINFSRIPLEYVQYRANTPNFWLYFLRFESLMIFVVQVMMIFALIWVKMFEIVFRHIEQRNFIQTEPELRN